jgi:DHA1 family tetracycline resistance protein-like MFS transporter
MIDDENQLLRVSPPRSVLSILFSVVFLDNLGFFIVLPYLFFFVQSLGGNAFLYGVLIASYSLMSFVFTPLVSRLSDSNGRRKILLIALFVSGTSYFLFGISRSIWLLFVARMMAGTTAATVPVAQAYVADITTEKGRLKYLGLLGAAAGTAVIIGPAIGGTLSSLYGYAVPSFLASVLAFTNFFSAYFRLPEPSRSIESPENSAFTLTALRNVLSSKSIKLLFAVYFLFFVSFVFFQVVLPPWLEQSFGFHSFQTGLLFFYVGAISVFTQAFLLPRLSRKRSNSTLITYGILMLTIGLLALFLLPNVAFLFVAGAAISLGFGIQYTTLNTLISINAPKEAQGGTLGIAWSLAGLAQTITPTIAAFTFAVGTSIGFAGLSFVFSATIAILTIPFILKLKKHQD